jgi:hypothetical protein
MTDREPRKPAVPSMIPAAQLESIVSDIRARREQIKALQEQLVLFDEQLAVLENSLTPLVEWARTWAGMEKAVLDFWRLPGAGLGKEQ